MKNRTIILFDGVCNLCNSSVQFVLKHEKEHTIKFASLQSDFGQNVLKENGLNFKDFESIIFLEQDEIYSKSEAIFHISKYLNTPFSWLQYFNILPTFLNDFVYNFVAINRYRFFGKKDSCFMPSQELKERFID